MKLQSKLLKPFIEHVSFVQIIYHFFCSPIRVYHDEHIACLVSRQNSRDFAMHQFRSKTIYYKQKRSDALSVGTSVLLKLKPKAFQKESSAFSPRYSDTIYKIVDIDKSEFPPLYSLQHFPTKRRYELNFVLVVASCSSHFQFVSFCLFSPGFMHLSYKRLMTLYALLR